jgi:hypothetical protein
VARGKNAAKSPSTTSSRLVKSPHLSCPETEHIASFSISCSQPIDLMEKSKSSPKRHSIVTWLGKDPLNYISYLEVCQNGSSLMMVLGTRQLKSISLGFTIVQMTSLLRLPKEIAMKFSTAHILLAAEPYDQVHLSGCQIDIKCPEPATSVFVLSHTHITCFNLYKPSYCLANYLSLQIPIWSNSTTMTTTSWPRVSGL